MASSAADAPLAPPASQNAAVSGAVGSLLDNANYWRSHGELPYALTELKRVLQFAPNNPDVLAAATEVALAQNDYKSADLYQAALSRAAPNDPRVALLAAEPRYTKADIATLEDARALARAGKGAEAAAKYQTIFKNGMVPMSLAVEYYSALAATDAGFDEANTKLAALTDKFPKEARLQLAYAQLLVLHEDTRNDGIKRLSDLSTNPEVERAARQAWRQTLLWQGPSERARSQIETYLQTNPTDGEIEAKRRDFNANLPDESARSMLRGYNAMGTDPTTAEGEFMTALRINPKNVDAMVMLAALLRSESREAEAQAFLNRALVLAPERRDEFMKSAGGEFSAAVPFGVRERVRVGMLTLAGQYDQAIDLLSVSMAGRPDGPQTVMTWLQIASIQRSAGRLADAQASYQKALALSPTSAAANCGLADLAVLNGQFDDATSLYNKAAGLSGKAKKSQAADSCVANGRVMLVERRAAQGDAASGAALYQTALTADPKNMALRASFARFLAAHGQTDQAWVVIQAGLTANANSVAAQQVAFAFATETGNTQKLQELTQRFGTKTALQAGTASRQRDVAAQISAAKLDAMRRSVPLAAQ